MCIRDRRRGAHCLHVDIGQAVNVGHNVQKFIHSLHSGKHRSANAEKTHLIGVIDIMRRTAQSRFIHQRVCFRKRVDVALSLIHIDVYKRQSLLLADLIQPESAN